MKVGRIQLFLKSFFEHFFNQNSEILLGLNQTLLS